MLANNERISSNTFVYVAGLIAGLRPMRLVNDDHLVHVFNAFEEVVNVRGGFGPVYVSLEAGECPTPTMIFRNRKRQ